jgi:nitroreductase
MCDTLKLLKERRTVRQYQNKRVPKEILQQILDVALVSPTAKNVEGFDILVVTNQEIMKKSSDIILSNIPEEFKSHFNSRIQSLGVKNPITCDAPAVFVLYKNERYEQEYGEIDVGLSIMSIMFAARALGLETMTLGFLRNGNGVGVEDLLRIPKGNILIGVSVGYGAKNLKLPKKVVRTKGTFLE